MSVQRDPTVWRERIAPSLAPKATSVLTSNSSLKQECLNCTEGYYCNETGRFDRRRRRRRKRKRKKKKKRKMKKEKKKKKKKKKKKRRRKKR